MRSAREFCQPLLTMSRGFFIALKPVGTPRCGVRSAQRVDPTCKEKIYE